MPQQFLASLEFRGLFLLESLDFDLKTGDPVVNLILSGQIYARNPKRWIRLLPLASISPAGSQKLLLIKPLKIGKSNNVASGTFKHCAENGTRGIPCEDSWVVIRAHRLPL
jgi:hypothetical protein